MTLTFATHHKAGTVLLLNYAQFLVGLESCKYTRMHSPLVPRQRLDKEALSDSTIVRLEHSCLFQVEYLRRYGPVIHIIRDPRSLIVSAARYHLTSTESWLDEPDSRFGGQTFRQRLLDCEDEDAQQTFELEYNSKYEIADMMAIHESGLAYEYMLEALSWDETLSTAKQLVSSCMLDEKTSENSVEYFRQNSLFSEGFSSRHSTLFQARTSTCKLLGKKTLEHYFDLFGAAHISLGYQL